MCDDSMTTVWEEIANTLSSEIHQGHYPVNERLPTEAVLSQRFGVNRHTIRRAIAQLRDEGLVYSRRGAGVFVLPQPVEYPLSKRVRFKHNVLAAGQTPSRRLLLLETRRGNDAECRALKLPKSAMVHVAEGLSFADDQPIAIFRSAFPAERLPDLPGHLPKTLSITEALRACGVVDYVRVSTRLTAKLATALQANHLHIAAGAPILRAISINADTNGNPVEYGQTWFAGDRVSLYIDDESDED